MPLLMIDRFQGLAHSILVPCCNDTRLGWKLARSDSANLDDNRGMKIHFEILDTTSSRLVCASSTDGCICRCLGHLTCIDGVDQLLSPLVVRSWRVSPSACNASHSSSSPHWILHCLGLVLVSHCPALSFHRQRKALSLSDNELADFRGQTSRRLSVITAPVTVQLPSVVTWRQLQLS